MTAADLHDALAPLGADLMVRAMGALERGGLQLTKQSEAGVTYAAKIDKAEARIDWSKPARAVLRHIHGLSPFPGAWCEMPIEGEPVRVKILRCELARGLGRAGRIARRSPDDCLRRRRDPHSRTAARRQAADEGGGISARHAAQAAGAAELMPRYKLTIEYDGAPFCRLADPGQRPLGAGRAGSRGQGDLRRARSACTARAAPMPACMRWRRSRIAISQSTSRRAGCATA